jgi:hypothetical protein
LLLTERAEVERWKRGVGTSAHLPTPPESGYRIVHTRLYHAEGSTRG